MLQRYEDANAAGRRIDRASKCDDQKQRVIVDGGKGQSRGSHQTGADKQELAVIVSGAEEADSDGQERGTKQRCGRDEADLEGRKPEREQTDRQQDGDETVAEVA